MFDLTKIQKPQRYVGNEWNVVKKSHDRRLKICLAYPDLYEVGMSNLGLRIIYGLLNDLNDVACERVFMPGYDFVQFLKEKNKKLASLESKASLDSFDVVGFNFSHELNFTNFLHMLSLGGIELEANKRQDIIVMGGGVANPEPLAKFVDLFCLGEFEEVAADFVRILRKYKHKEERLQAFSQIEGFYVPRFYEPVTKNGKVCIEKTYKNAQLPLKRAYVKNLNDSFYPTRWLLPNTAIVHDRAQIEIARGCIHKCVYCQARSLYYPYRQRKISTILGIAKSIYENSGYENFSFLSLSASDYTHIEDLIDQTLEYFDKRKIGLSLPSMRVGDLVGGLYKKIISLKKTSLTVAVEAARDCLRQRLNKKIDIKELFEAAKIIRSLGLRHLKLYFMYGFCDEEEEDLIAIGSFLKQLHRESKLDIHASINAFIPKPFSIWQTQAMQPSNVLKRKRSIILTNIPRCKQIKTSIASPERSVLEATISRADREFSRVIERVYNIQKSEGLFAEEFSWNTWRDAMRQERIDYNYYLEAKGQNCPWSFINRNDASC